MAIPLKLQVFEGPLDLLLHLIDKNKIDIYDIPIVEITDQYLEYVNNMDKEDLNIVSEFLVMAATLLDIKSKMLLPKDETEEEEEDPRSELVQKLLEYKMYKYMSLDLKDRQLDAGKVVYKEPTIPEEIANYKEKVDVAELMQDVTLAKLQSIFNAVMRRQVEKRDPIRSQFGKIEKEEVSLEEKMSDLTAYAQTHRHFSFRGLLTSASTKVEKIVTFLAILELMKVGKISIFQENIFDDIFNQFHAR